MMVDSHSNAMLPAANLHKLCRIYVYVPGATQQQLEVLVPTSAWYYWAVGVGSFGYERKDEE